MPMFWTFNCFLGCIEFRLPKKEDQVARIGVMGGGGGEIRARPERKRFFSIDPFPYSVLNLSQPTKSWAISTILEAAPCTTVGAKVLKCLSLCPATIGRMKNNWGNGDKPLCISYLSFHAREAAHPFAFYHFRPNSLTLIVFDLTLWHHWEAAPA